MPSERIRSSSPRNPRASTANPSFPRCMTDCHRPLLYRDPSSDRRLSLGGTSPSHYCKIDPNLGLCLRALSFCPREKAWGAPKQAPRHIGKTKSSSLLVYSTVSPRRTQASLRPATYTRDALTSRSRSRSATPGPRRMGRRLRHWKEECLGWKRQRRRKLTY